VRRRQLKHWVTAVLFVTICAVVGGGLLYMFRNSNFDWWLGAVVGGIVGAHLWEGRSR
jgi:hypothetical protein